MLRFLRLNVAKYVLKNCKVEIINPHKINQIPPKPKTPNIKTSLSDDSSNLLCDVFVLFKNATLMGDFGFGSIGFDVICYYTFSNKNAFLTHLKASKIKNKVTF